VNPTSKTDCNEQQQTAMNSNGEQVKNFHASRPTIAKVQFSTGILYCEGQAGVKVWGTAPTRRIGAQKSQIEHVGAHTE
jgi:hypothetical protein